MSGLPPSRSCLACAFLAFVVLDKVVPDAPCLLEAGSLKCRSQSEQQFVPSSTRMLGALRLIWLFAL